MFPNTARYLSVSIVIILLLLAGGAFAETSGPSTVPVPDAWKATYTQEEYDAIQRTLWAGNFTLQDLDFKKEYTEGYQCLPIVSDMLKHPLSIAPDMDAMVAGFASWRNIVPSPLAEVAQSLGYFPGLPEKVPGIIDSRTKYGADFLNGATPGTQGLVDFLTKMAGGDVSLPFDAHEREVLRDNLPMSMSWHSCFTSPYTQEQQSTWEEELKTEPPDYIYATASKIDFAGLASDYMRLCPDPRGWLTELPKDIWPTTKIIVNTTHGRVGIGTLGNDEWEGDFTVLIDPGGDDHYKNCRLGAAFGTEGSRFGYFVDLGGNDFYDCADTDITLGAAILGVAAFYDLGQGNDRYVGGSCILGASMGGIATFYDDGGSDQYDGKVYTEGAAGFGIGVMTDCSVQAAPVVATDVETPDPINIASFDNDRIYAWTNSQAFARTLGIAICSNERGNEFYYAGGVYLDAPLFSDRYQSFSQGFAIGEREIDYAGGIALIVDYSGNDRYLGDVYDQGVGYWYSAGFMYDGAGNDTYEMCQYGQGSGIHLAIGGLIDVSGNDSYTLHTGLGTGGSHDFAASILHDRGGNDQYFGNTSCNAGALTNSAVLFIDRAGDDTYAGRRDGGINFGRPERGFISIGVFVDLAGNDDYLGIMDNGEMWSQTSVGVGCDIAPPPQPEQVAGAPVPAAPEPEKVVPQPEIISYQGELTKDVFDKLWEIATRWAVGDNRYIVPHAIDRLIAFGPAVLPFLSEEFKDDKSGLAEDPFTKILKANLDKDRQGVLDVLKKNVESHDDMRLKVALSVISELKPMELESSVAALLDDPDPANQRRAIGVLGILGSHVADQRLIANLDPTLDEAMVKNSMDALFKLDVYCWQQLRPLLEYPTITVREALIGDLIGKHDAYDKDLRRELVDTAAGNQDALDTRSIRSVLKVFASGAMLPDDGTANAIAVLLDAEDWGTRADAVKVVERWRDMADKALASGADPSAAMMYETLLQPLTAKLDEMRKTETDPFVLFVLSGKQPGKK